MILQKETLLKGLLVDSSQFLLAPHYIEESKNVQRFKCFQMLTIIMVDYVWGGCLAVFISWLTPPKLTRFF